MYFVWHAKARHLNNCRAPEPCSKAELVELNSLPTLLKSLVQTPSPEARGVNYCYPFTDTRSIELYILTCLGVVTATLGTPEQQLRHDLLTNYHHDVRPVLKPGDVVNITFSYKLARIVSLVSRGCAALV